MRNILAKRLKECRKEKRVNAMSGCNILDITEKTYPNYELMTQESKLKILIKLQMFL